MTRTAPLIATLAAALHGLAAMVLVVVLRRGLAPHSAASRLLFMNEHPALWRASWFVWSAAALSLVAFFAATGPLLRTFAASAVVVLVVAGAVTDIACEMRYALVLPRLSGDAFARLDRTLEATIGGVANGLYTAALAVFLLATRRSSPSALRSVGWLVVCAGIVLSGASFLHRPLLATASSALLFPAFVVWLVLAGRWLRAAA